MFLLEAVLASAILAVALTGLAMLLIRCMDTVKTLHKDAALRGALETRTAEMTVETLEPGQKDFTYAEGKIRVEQEIEPAKLDDRHGRQLPGLYEVKLRASFAEGEWPPLRTMRIVSGP